MKRYLLAYALSFGTLASVAQSGEEGRLTYEMTLHVHATLTKEQQAYKSLIPPTVKVPVTIFFKKDTYRIEIHQPQKPEGNVSITIPLDKTKQIVRRDRSLTYTLISSNKTNYHTEVPIGAVAVKIDKKASKKLLGYTCYKALFKDEDNEVYELWITNGMRPQLNPLNPGIVAGTVLEIHSKKMSFKALRVEFNIQADALFEVPADSKKITEEQAEDLQEESQLEE